MNTKPTYRATHRRDPLPPLDDSAFVDAPKNEGVTISQYSQLLRDEYRPHNLGVNPIMRDEPLIFMQRYETPGTIPQARVIVACCILSAIAVALAFFHR